MAKRVKAQPAKGMSDKGNSETPLEVSSEVSSFAEKTNHRWIEAEPDNRIEHRQRLAQVHTPEAFHNEFGPDSELKPDPGYVPSLITLAAILGIEIVPGERFVEGQIEGQTSYDADHLADVFYDAGD